MARGRGSSSSLLLLPSPFSFSSLLLLPSPFSPPPPFSPLLPCSSSPPIRRFRGQGTSPAAGTAVAERGRGGDGARRCLGFRHRTSQLARKLLNFLPQPLHAMIRHLDKFHDFRTSFAFYIIKKHLFNKLVVMFRETDVRNFTNVPAHGLKIHSKT